MRSRVCNVTHGVEMGIGRVSKLHCRLHADEAVVGVDEGVLRGGLQAVEELGIGRLSRSCDHKVGGEGTPILQFDLNGGTRAAEGVTIRGKLDSRAAHEAMTMSADSFVPESRRGRRRTLLPIL